MTILQFGTGRFLRGFFAPIVPDEGCITVVQSRPDSDGAVQINAQPDGYHVWTRGIQSGQIIDDHQTVRSIRRALNANTEWERLRELALDPRLELIVSNTTAAGLERDDRDTGTGCTEVAPWSFPAKITCLLWHRYQAQQPGVTLLPMELVEQNGTRLKSLVLQQAAAWTTTHQPAFLEWLTSENRWLNNLVDRIVVSPSEPPPWSGEDALAVVGEPFRMLAIEDDRGSRQVLPDDPMILWTDDLAPYFLRKVRILNGLHTAMVAKCLPSGLQTVRECVETEWSRRWLEELLHDEILPTLADQGQDETSFAEQVMERFENPFFEHLLSDIANGHATKLQIRLQPTADEFRAAFQREPAKLNEVLQSSTSE
ncbi:MAG: hypothetical protein MK108_10480 [Mariniblastus sp.]|nr:hypothetical protein [Mariniblastus sp.]